MRMSVLDFHACRQNQNKAFEILWRDKLELPKKCEKTNKSSSSQVIIRQWSKLAKTHWKKIDFIFYFHFLPFSYTYINSNVHIVH